MRLGIPLTCDNELYPVLPRLREILHYSPYFVCH